MKIYDQPCGFNAHIIWDTQSTVPNTSTIGWNIFWWSIFIRLCFHKLFLYSFKLALYECFTKISWKRRCIKIITFSPHCDQLNVGNRWMPISVWLKSKQKPYVILKFKFSLLITSEWNSAKKKPENQNG